MIILEDVGVKDNLIKKIYDIIKKNFNNENYKFEEKIDDYVIWCDNDKERAVFIQAEDGSCYGTVCKNDIDTGSEADILDYIKDQLNDTKDD
jgi:hypothetical protein